ncbi:uncharacterized protein PHALS_13056 [Plasmopara halstedii]|uniref:Transmembrane protein n=1 Tax=Plasmopara halstedii TaxID=4781 RepID=A0A0N7L5Z0_PLAHL|nr:uncharacterized protein PHALS_13056 [Plasmopara halstedii]CEG42811.1 transmembrane protein [Plasmopara halstedii]|eukprot:XP_024579180.1 transmembrane protein [Plasmopara halstedii]
MTSKLRAKARRALHHFLRYIASHCLSLCWGTYILGILWLLLHPAITITTGELKCRGTYISENALLIDLMEARASQEEAHIAHLFHKELLELPNLSRTGCRNNCSHVVDWIGTKLRSLDRVEAYTHVYQTDELSNTRTNVYGLLRASPLADGKESIVLVTHYRNVGADSGDYSSLSLGLALLKYLAKAKWLAKDVILLVADDGDMDGKEGFSPGTEAWLQAYHVDPVESGVHGTLPMRAGVIRAAINLETLTNSRLVNSVGIYTAGMHGQLPNLDLVNTAVRALRRHHIPTLLNRADTEHDLQKKGFVSTTLEYVSSVCEKYTPLELRESVRKYLINLRGMLYFMTTLATGPSGPHANFISYNIDSITLSLTQRSTLKDRSLSTRDVLRSIEMVVRAMSNLEEKLHQSFFLYVLPTTLTFVSVGEYIYAVLLVSSPAMVHILYLATRTNGMRVAFALTIFLMVEALCVLLICAVCKYFATPIGSLHTFSYIEKPATGWFILASVISMAQVLVLLVGMPALRSITSFSGCVDVYDWKKRVTTFEALQRQKSAQDATSDSKKTCEIVDTKASVDIAPLDSGWRAIKFITMVVLVFAHCIMGIINYPMALFGAIPMAQFARVVPIHTTTKLKNISNGFWLFISSPLVLLILLIYSRQDAIAALFYVVDSFAQRINLLTLMYTLCIYVPVHTLSLVIWLFPTPVLLDQKLKLE